MSPYPIVERKALGQVKRGLLRLPSRELAELPEQPPGTTLVASIDGDYELLPGRSQLKGTERPLVGAASVIVIDEKPGHLAVATLEIASKEPGEAFRVQVSFTCTVKDPLEVARRGSDDIVPLLESHLMADARLMELGQSFTVVDSAGFRKAARARIKAWCRGRPPLVPGLEISLGNISIDNPEDLRRHAEAKRAERFGQEITKLKDDFLLKQARTLEEILKRDPEAVEAIFLRNGDPRMGEAANRRFAERARKEEALMKLVDELVSRGQMDGVAIDMPRLFDEIVGNALSPGTARTTDGEGRQSYILSPESEPSDAPKRELTNADAEGEAADDVEGIGRPEDPPDEDSLDG